MDGWFKGLLAATCIVFLAAVGWWGWSERNEVLARAVEVEREAVEAWAEQDADRREQRQECQAIVAAWDNVHSNREIRRTFGDRAEGRVESCRIFLR